MQLNPFVPWIGGGQDQLHTNAAAFHNPEVQFHQTYFSLVQNAKPIIAQQVSIIMS